MASGARKGLESLLPDDLQGVRPMDVFIYIYEDLNVGRDELEEALEEAFDDERTVTGGGAGLRGCNIDLFVPDGARTHDEVVSLVRKTLSVFSIPKTSKIVVDGKEFTMALRIRYFGTDTSYEPSREPIRCAFPIDYRYLQLSFSWHRQPWRSMIQTNLSSLRRLNSAHQANARQVRLILGPTLACRLIA